MANIIGVLGEATAVAVGATTAYTVPAGKAAKVQIMYRAVAAANSTIAVAVNGLTIFTTGALVAGEVSFSGREKAHIADAAADINGGSDDTTVAPYKREFMLSAGDTISYTVGTLALSSMNFQVIGAEIDIV